MSTARDFFSTSPSSVFDGCCRAVRFPQAAQQEGAKNYRSMMKVTLIALLTVLLTTTTRAGDEWMSEHKALSFSVPIEITESDDSWSCSTKLGGQFTVSPTKLGLSTGGAALYYRVIYPYLFERFRLFFEESFLFGDVTRRVGDTYGDWPADLNWGETRETHQVRGEIGSLKHAVSFSERHLVLHQLLEGGHSSLTIGLEVEPHKRNLTAVFHLKDFADRIRKARDLCHFHP